MVSIASRDDSSVYNNRFRVARMKHLLHIVDEIIAERSVCSIIDLGGRYEFWKGLEPLWGDRNVKITLVDLCPTNAPDPRFTSVQGDACALVGYSDQSFDLAFSNSVLEHVGSWTNKVRMAGEVRRVAKRYYVQTPNFWFPLEPHFRAPFIHWLPRPMQRKLVMSFDFAFHRRASDFNEADRILGDASLLDVKDMEFLFPDAVEIKRERLFGVLTKSLIAVR